MVFYVISNPHFLLCSSVLHEWFGLVANKNSRKDVRKKGLLQRILAAETRQNSQLLATNKPPKDMPTCLQTSCVARGCLWVPKPERRVSWLHDESFKSDSVSNMPMFQDRAAQRSTACNLMAIWIDWYGLVWYSTKKINEHYWTFVMSLIGEAFLLAETREPAGKDHWRRNAWLVAHSIHICDMFEYRIFIISYSFVVQKGGVLIAVGWCRCISFLFVQDETKSFLLQYHTNIYIYIQLYNTIYFFLQKEAFSRKFQDQQIVLGYVTFVKALLQSSALLRSSLWVLEGYARC